MWCGSDNVIILHEGKNTPLSRIMSEQFYSLFIRTVPPDVTYQTRDNTCEGRQETGENTVAGFQGHCFVGCWMCNFLVVRHTRDNRRRGAG